MKLFQDLLNIIFPRTCCICKTGLSKNEELLCFHCRSELPKTSITNIYENELTDRFLGKVNIEFGVSYLAFNKAGVVQKLLHQIKYNNYPELGELVGQWFGHELIELGIHEKTDVVVPVPLHRRKEHKRGYNQSLLIAQGISKVLVKNVDYQSLVRIQHTESQTTKSREQRWKSVENAFEVVNDQSIIGKQILLVDDVVTTGATLEACGKALLDAGAGSIGIASLALAK